MRRGFRLLSIVAAVGLVCGGTAVAQTSGSAVTGTVVTLKTKVPVASARVALVRSGASPDIVFTSATSEAGAYSFAGVPNGTYVLSVQVAGFDTVSRTVVVSAATRQDVLIPEKMFALQFGERSGLDLTLIQPGSYVYFDSGVDDKGEVDFYKDGKMSLTVQLVGVDLVGWTDSSGGTRVGVNVGTGISTAQGDKAEDASNASPAASAVMVSVSFFLDLNRLARLEIGKIYGRSAKEALLAGQRDDTAVFFGISLKTSLGNELVKLLR